MARSTQNSRFLLCLAGWGLAGCLVSSVANAADTSDLERWQAFMEPASQAHMMGNMDSAEDLYLEALALADRFDLSGEYLERTMAGLGGLYLSENRYGEAASLYREALSIAETLYDAGHARHDVVEIYRKALEQTEDAERRLTALKRRADEVLARPKAGPGPAPTKTASGATAAAHVAVWPTGVPLRGMPVSVSPHAVSAAIASLPSSSPSNGRVLSNYRLGAAVITPPVPETPPSENASPSPTQESAPLEVAAVVPRVSVFRYPAGVPMRGTPLPPKAAAKISWPSSPPVAEAAEVAVVEDVKPALPLPEVAKFEKQPSAPRKVPIIEARASTMSDEAPEAILPARNVTEVSTANTVAEVAPQPPADPSVTLELPPLRGIEPKAVTADAVAPMETSAGDLISEPAPEQERSGPLVIRITPRDVPAETERVMEATTEIIVAQAPSLETAEEPVSTVPETASEDAGSWSPQVVQVDGQSVETAAARSLEADPAAPPGVADRASAAEAAAELAARREVLKRHPILGIRLPGAERNLGPIFPDTPRLADTEEAYVAQLEDLEKSLGAKHADVAVVLYKLARLYQRQSRYELAGATYERCLAIREDVLPEGHPDIIETLRSYSRLMRASGLSEIAKELRERANVHRAKSAEAKAE
ncbi:MAG: tetratricopeptide repeat protein [Rhodospirillales bacterium]